MSSIPSFALKFHNKVFMRYLGELMEYLFFFVIETVLWVITIIPSWSMSVPNKMSRQGPPSSAYDVLITYKFYSFNWLWFSYVQKILSLFVDFRCPPLETRSLIPSSLVPSLSHLTICTRIKSNIYFSPSPATVFSDPGLYTLVTFHVPNIISVFLCLCRSKESVILEDACNVS
jgi:hypothetical protein